MRRARLVARDCACAACTRARRDARPSGGRHPVLAAPLFSRARFPALLGGRRPAAATAAARGALCCFALALHRFGCMLAGRMRARCVCASCAAMADGAVLRRLISVQMATMPPLVPRPACCPLLRPDCRCSAPFEVCASPSPQLPRARLRVHRRARSVVDVTPQVALSLAFFLRWWMVRRKCCCCAARALNDARRAGERRRTAGRRRRCEAAARRRGQHQALSCGVCIDDACCPVELLSRVSCTPCADGAVRRGRRRAWCALAFAPRRC